MTVTLYQVGGSVRDEILGLRSKDIDYAVEADSYETMKSWLAGQDFAIFLETPEFFTIRAQFPKGHVLARQTADFVLCRKEGTYTDGRRPDNVAVGNIYDDLARRDFTVNAIARATDGTYIDPHGGQRDIRDRMLRCVGSAHERLHEDALRALRAIRFFVTKDFDWDTELWTAMTSDWLPPLLANVSRERKREELIRAFRKDTLETLRVLTSLPREFQEACFIGGLWLKPTLQE